MGSYLFSSLLGFCIGCHTGGPKIRSAAKSGKHLDTSCPLKVSATAAEGNSAGMPVLQGEKGEKVIFSPNAFNPANSLQNHGNPSALNPKPL